MRRLRRWPVLEGMGYSTGLTTRSGHQQGQRRQWEREEQGVGDGCSLLCNFAVYRACHNVILCVTFKTTHEHSIYTVALTIQSLSSDHLGTHPFDTSHDARLSGFEPGLEAIS